MDNLLHKSGTIRLAWFLALLAAIVILPGASKAHSWYPLECCHSNDCAPVKAEFVREVSGAFLFTIIPNSHPMAKGWDAPRQFLIPYRELRPSPDGEWHLWIVAGVARCAFGNVGGS